MSSKAELQEVFSRILWAEREMFNSCSSCTSLKDENICQTLKEIEADEARHINMVEQILSILQG